PHVQVFGTDYPTPDGTCIRDYIHVNDLSDAHILGLEYLRAGNPSNIFNLGSESGFSVREVINVCAQITGTPIAVKEGPRRAGDAVRLVADATHAKTTLGWQPRCSDVQTIIRDAWRSFSHAPRQSA
ncbi:MAG: GDP-mannose 4,6-dehydratase, partial [bacterium]|nr:GDP-mannose 4,6-dehydratase [bacterium]